MGDVGREVTAGRVPERAAVGVGAMHLHEARVARLVRNAPRIAARLIDTVTFLAPEKVFFCFCCGKIWYFN